MDAFRLPEKWSDWEVTENLGTGSYGTVYKVVRRYNEQEFVSAVKVIHIPPEKADVEIIRREYGSEESLRLYYKDLVDSCVNEIKIMDALKGTSNIVSIEDYYVEECQDGIGWTIYIRMEYLESFSRYSKRRSLTEEEVIRAGIDVCTALEQCEKLHILHRDIKMDNLFISPLGFVKLGDFGVARQLEKSICSYSSRGTLSYMAPEVYQGKRYGEQADIYSLGIVMYRLMNRNRDPFVDPEKQVIYYRDKEEALRQRMEGKALPDPLNASPAFAAVIQKACQFRPELRYHNAAELKEDLQKLLQAKGKGKKVKPKGKRGRAAPDIHAFWKKVAIITLCCLLLLAVLVFGLIQIQERDREIDGLPPATTETETSLPETEGLTEQEVTEAETNPSEQAEAETETSSPGQTEDPDADSEMEEAELRETELTQTEPPETQEEAGTSTESETVSTLPAADHEAETDAELVTYDISGCADFIFSKEDGDAIVKRYFFGGKMEDQLIEQGVDPELAKELIGMIILDDFSLNKSEGLKTGDVITMTFVGKERIEEEYKISLDFEPIAKLYN